MYSFSTLDRDIILQELQDQEFDLVVIGGGITGAGIILDAVTRGLKVALVEKVDFASGTSSKSTKLIHGGLRYLKQAQFSLVKEVGKERAVLHKNAPHLVKSEAMMIPNYKDLGYPRWQINLGLKVYDWLADVPYKEQRVMLDREDAVIKEPLLKEDGLKGAGYYFEYRTDDARLTIEVLKTAIKNGAFCLNYLEVKGFTYKEDKISGIQVLDHDTDEVFEIKAKKVVNAAGSWVDRICQYQGEVINNKLVLSKGVHIVVSKDRFPIQTSIYFNIPDGRMAFVIPREDVVYIGTTDEIYEGSIDGVDVRLADVLYLLDAVNNYFQTDDLTIKDVISSWAGLRPLIAQEGKSVGEISRKDELFVSSQGLITIAGGKLTGFRSMADRVVSTVIKLLDDPKYNSIPCRTEFVTLQGGNFGSIEEMEMYYEKIRTKILGFGLDEKWAEYLVHRYGKQSGVICYHLSRYNEINEVSLVRSELWFTVKNELVYSLIDFIERRSGRLFFYPDTVHEALPHLMFDCKQYFKWSPARAMIEQRIVEERLKAIVRFE